MTTASNQMMHASAVRRLHPLSIFVYLISIMIVTMMTLSPVFLTISLFGALLLTGMLQGVRKLLASLCYALPLLALIAFTNPLFVRKGDTVLFFMNGQPFTLEAVCFGLAAGVMILSVFYWFRCYHLLMTSDKFMALFGGSIPKFSLLISIVLRFVPLYKRQYRKISEAQIGMGMFASVRYRDRVRARLRVILALIGWALENSVDTADSMRARGYGLKKRTVYADTRFHGADFVVLALCAAALTALIAGLLLGAGQVDYYPVFTWSGKVLQELLTGVVFLGAVLVLPALECKEGIRWQYLRSKI